MGSDIVFAPGQYDPASQAGQQLIAHEMSHVLQQRQGATEVVSGMVEVHKPPVDGE